MEHCLRLYAERKLTLAYVSGPRILGRSQETLKRYCRKFGIAFPDYVPMHMRPKKER